MKNNRLLIGILAGIILGTLIGGLLPDIGTGISFIGELFIKTLSMLVVPLIVAAMITGISRMGDIRNLGPLGRITIGYYLGTTAIAVITGMLLVVVLQPGKQGIDPPASGHTAAISSSTGPEHQEEPPQIQRAQEEKRTIVGLLKEVISGLVPSNIFKAMAENDILPVIIFSLLLGGVLTTLGEQGKPVLDFFISLNEAVMKIIHMIMYTAPVGIGALIAGRLGDAGGFSGFIPELIHLRNYSLTVIAGLLIHSIIILPLLLKIFGKISPVRFAANSSPALLTAFSTASSSATLPVTMECAEEKNRVSPRTAGFVLPLGATINMDGTALYEAVAVIFIAQMSGIALSGPEFGIIFLTATLAAVGAAGIPEAGLVTMVLVLKAVNLPVEGISLILAIDWFLDRCRTTVNVWGDSVGAKIIDRLLRNGTTHPDGTASPAFTPRSQ